MKWGNYIKRTAVRRVVWVVVGVVVYGLLSWLSPAYAAICGLPTRAEAAESAGANIIHDSEGQSYQACMSTPNWIMPSSGIGGREMEVYACVPRSGSQGGGFTALGQYAGTSYRQNCDTYTPTGTWTDSVGGWRFANSCASRGPSILRVNHSRSNWTPEACSTGCNYQVESTANNCRTVTSGHPNRQGYTCWYNATPTGGTCNDELGDGKDQDSECPVGMDRASDGDCKPRGDCPIGHFKVDGVCTPDGACPAGHVKGPDGSCNPESCPAGQARGADGTCKSDDNEDGTPDEDEEGGDGDNKDGKKFSGGDSCEVPPTCSGDAIMCGQARIQWRIDCNTRRNTTVAGGNSCAPGNAPVCVGEMCDHVEQTKMLQLWESQCALQRIADAAEGEGTGSVGDMSGVEERLDGIANFLDGDGDCMATEEGCGEGGDDHWIDGEDVEASEWSSGLASTGSCPAPISRTITLGQHVQDIEFSYQPLCDFAALLRWVLITAATILSALLIGGFRSNA